MKCKHENISIIEYGTSQTSHDRDSGGEWTHVSDIGHYTGVIEVTCYDCGFNRRYGRNRPQWIEKLVGEIANNYKEIRVLN
jgi:hypothetical protein